MPRNLLAADGGEQRAIPHCVLTCCSRPPVAVAAIRQRMAGRITHSAVCRRCAVDRAQHTNQSSLSTTVRTGGPIRADGARLFGTASTNSKTVGPHRSVLALCGGERVRELGAESWNSSRNISAYIAHFFPWVDADTDLRLPRGLVVRAGRGTGTAVPIDPSRRSALCQLLGIPLVPIDHRSRSSHKTEQSVARRTVGRVGRSTGLPSPGGARPA